MQTILGSNGQIGEGLAKELHYSVVKMWTFRLGGLFNKRIRELQELLPRYKYDNLFISDKFKEYFPTFQITSYEKGITEILNEQIKK